MGAQFPTSNVGSYAAPIAQYRTLEAPLASADRPRQPGRKRRPTGRAGKPGKTKGRSTAMTGMHKRRDKRWSW